MSLDESALDLDALAEAEPITSDDEDAVQSAVDQDEEELPTEGGADIDLPESEAGFDSTEAETAHSLGPEAVNTAQCRWCREEFRGITSRRTHSCPERETTPAPSTQVHQCSARLLWEVGASSYWDVIDALPDPDEASVDESSLPSVSVAGETWHVDPESLSVWADGIQVPDRHDRPERRAREASLRLVAPPTVDDDWDAVDDDIDARGVTFTVRPAWPDMRRARDGEPAGGIPTDVPGGIRVTVDGSSVDPALFTDAWRGLLEALGCESVARRCQSDALHEWSTGTAAAVYVRLDREVAQQRLVEDGALFDRLSRVSRTSGGKGWLAWDDREVTGHLTDLALDHQTTSRLFADGVSVGGLWHCYHPAFARGATEDADQDDPLADPKLEVAWTPGRDRVEERGVDVFERDAVPFRDPDRVDLFDVLEDLDQMLVNTLDWAGVDLGNESLFTADPYYEATVSERRVTMVQNPLPEIEREETDLVQQVLATGSLTDAQRAVIASVVDGGEQHWSDIVDATGVSRSTVYQAASAVDDVLEVADGIVQTTDEVVRDRLQESLDSVGGAENFVAGEVDPLEARIDGVGEDSALARWARRHAGVGVQLQNGEMVVDLGHEKRTGPEVRRLLRAGLDAADLSDLGDEFMTATFHWATTDGRETRPHAQGVWDGISGSPRPYGITIGTGDASSLGRIG